MMPSKTSCMPSSEKMGMLYRKNDGTPLRHEFHYEPIFTWFEKTRSLLPMWWLMTQCERWWLRMSLVNQYVQLQNLTPLLKFTNIKGFTKGITLFWWPWKCIAHWGVIWIVSLRNVFDFYTIDVWKVICPCLFTFIFRQHINIALQHALASIIERKIVLAGDACFRPPIIIRYHNLHACKIRGAMGEIASYHERD
jgi:hypothetical protein